MSEAWKVLDLINAAKSFFEKKGIADTARLDAELLLAEVLGCGRIDLYVRHDELVDDALRAEFRDLVRRRGEREPVKQMLGRCEFMSHEFILTPDVLVPRPETETLVGCVLDALGEGPQFVCDIGTGSGNVAVSIALARAKATVWATDVSDAALAVARRNAEKHNVAGRVTFCAGDLFEALAGCDIADGADCIVSNPPYVSESEFADLMPEVREYEPRLALLSGDDGLEHTSRILAGAPGLLHAGGLLAIEIGPHIADRAAAAAQAHDAYEEVRIVRDLSKRQRVLLARKSA